MYIAHIIFYWDVELYCFVVVSNKEVTLSLLHGMESNSFGNRLRDTVLMKCPYNPTCFLGYLG